MAKSLIQKALIVIGYAARSGAVTRTDTSMLRKFFHHLRRSLAAVLIVAGWCGVSSAADSLRILVTPQTDAADLAHARQLASTMGRQPYQIQVGDHDALVKALLSGMGDLIAEPLIVDETLASRVHYSEASIWTQSVLVGPESADHPSDQRVRVLVHPGGPHWARLLAAREKNPALELVPASARSDALALQQAVARGEAELAAIWLHELDSQLALPVHTPLSNHFPIAQLIKAGRTALTAALDTAAVSIAVLGNTHETYTGDLESIEQRLRLRVATVAEPGSYMPVDGRLRGFEYDLIHAFARSKGLALEVVVVPNRSQMTQYLTEGRADVAAAFLTPTARLRAQGVTFTQPYHEAAGRVMMLNGHRCPVHATDLTGLSLMVPQRSPFLNRLNRLAPSLGFEVRLSDPLMGVPALIEAAERSGAHGIVVDEHLAAANRAWRDDVMNCVAIGDPQPHAWAVRIRDQQLLKSLNAFIERAHRNGTVRIRRDEYFDDHEQMQAFAHAFKRYHLHGHLTDFDPLVRRYAALSGFDWRLILAQISRESGFDPNAVSSAGALGLMQLKPTTALDVGVDNPIDPEQGIRAGIAYMRWLWDLFEPSLRPDDRLWFSLAAYNAGLGQVRIARQVAAARGLDPDRWFGHVETTIRDARGPDLDAGLARLRGDSAIRYVRDVQVRYRAYAGLLDATAPRGMAPSVLATGG